MHLQASYWSKFTLINQEMISHFEKYHIITLIQHHINRCLLHQILSFLTVNLTHTTKLRLLIACFLWIIYVPGGCCALMASEVSAKSPTPALLMAATRNSYSLPSVSPFTVNSLLRMSAKLALKKKTTNKCFEIWYLPDMFSITHLKDLLIQH